MNDTDLYKLDTNRASDNRLYAGGQFVNDTNVRCPNCRMFRDETEPPVIEIELNRLGRLGFVEHLWNSHILPIFRQDIVDLWREAGLTGFDVKPVRITGWYNHPRKPLPENIPSYQRIVTASKVSMLEPKSVGVRCPVCGFQGYAFPKLGSHLPNGIRIDVSSWDGSDFFGVKGFDFLFCSRRAAEVTLNAGFNKRIAFIRLENVNRWEGYDVDKWDGEDYDKYVESFLIRRVTDL